MTELTYGDFAYDEDSRTLRGILLPFGERSRLNITGNEPVEFGADSISLPRDPSIVTLNRQHNRHDPVGRATVLEKRDAGVYAEFKVADTEEGDAYLTEQRGTLRKLSAEVTGLVRDGARAVKARLTGAALVTEGAFASAALFALAEDEAPEATVADLSHPELAMDALPEDITVSTPEGDQAVYTPEAAPAEDNQGPGRGQPRRRVRLDEFHRS
jgi:hypothetical protein